MKAGKPQLALAKLDQDWIGSVHAVLFGGGFRVADQIGTPLAFQWSSDTLPSVQTASRARPLAVVVLSASLANDATSISGLSCSWTWDAGRVRITAIPGLATSTLYDLVVLILEAR